ncbi:MAG: DUF721 domain-containing protein [Pseudomonadota bacterium]
MAAFRSNGPRRRDAAPTRLKRLFSDSSPLAALQEHARGIAMLKNALWPYLPPSIRPHCDLANYRDSTLFIHADSPLWAAKVRHASPQILHAARQRCKTPARKLVVRVRWPHSKAGAQRSQKKLIGRVTEHLEQASEHVDDPELAAIMQRIARRQPSDGETGSE